MNTTVVSFNGQDYEVPLSSKGTAKGQDLISAVGVGPGQTMYRANEDGHEVIQPSDDVSVRPGEQFNATPRFITASDANAEMPGPCSVLQTSLPIDWTLLSAMTGGYALVSLAGVTMELLLHPTTQVKLCGWILTGLLLAVAAVVAAVDHYTRIFGRFGESRLAGVVFGLALELSILPKMPLFARTYGIRDAIVDCAAYTLGGFLFSYLFFRDLAREAAQKKADT